MRQRIGLLVGSLVVLFLAVTPVGASTIAYMDPADVGNQIWNGSLGEDFAVNSPIMVSALGVYDSGQGGDIGGTLMVAIFNSSDVQVTPTETFSGVSGTLIGGDLFINLGASVVLPAGNYSVTTTGWDANIFDGNASCTGGTCGLPPTSYLPPTLNTGGGAITFTGIGFSGVPGLQYLAPMSPFPASELNAGSFQFGPVTSILPEPVPATAVGLGLMLLLVVAARRRSMPKSQ